MFIAAALAAAAMLFLPWTLVYGRGVRSGGGIALLLSLLGLALGGLVLHARLTPGSFARVAPLFVLTAVLTNVVALGLLVLVFVSGGCDSGHIGVGVWVGFAVIYLAGSGWGLRRPRRMLWAVPGSLLVAGLWLVAAATILTGSTGACLE